MSTADFTHEELVEQLAAFREQEAAVAEHLRLDARDAELRAEKSTATYALLFSIREELRALRQVLETR